MDQGYKVSHEFIDNMILAQLGSILEQGLHIDSKSRLQEIAQDQLGFTPAYEMLEAQGPDHEKEFVMGAYINGELIGRGSGSSKQKAEQSAAESALKAKNWENVIVHDPGQDPMSNV